MMVETRPVGPGWCCFGCLVWCWVSLFLSPPSDCSSLPSTMTWAPCPHGVRTRGKKTAEPPPLADSTDCEKDRPVSVSCGEAEGASSPLDPHLQPQKTSEGDGSKSRPNAPRLPQQGSSRVSRMSAHHTVGSWNGKNRWPQWGHGEVYGGLLLN